MKAVVFHSGYGCDTGCCGHVIELRNNEGNVVDESFQFSHPYSKDYLEFAKELVKETFGEEHVSDLDWSECLVIDD